VWWKILSGLVGNFVLFSALKNFENQLRFEKVIAESLVASFFGRRFINSMLFKDNY